MQMSGRQILEKEQYKSIHDVINDQGFAMHYRAIWKFSNARHNRERINAAKQKDRLTSFLMLRVLEAKIFFQYGFLEEHKVCVNNRFPM